ncbi:hypothetical protein B5G09_05280 [Alistipes sp. An54]|nr:hypothetical protein B5G09_05280 [Alistipes sp. An54]
MVIGIFVIKVRKYCESGVVQRDISAKKQRLGGARRSRKAAADRDDGRSGRRQVGTTAGRDAAGQDAAGRDDGRSGRRQVRTRLVGTTAGRDAAGRDAAGRDAAGQDAAGRDAAGRDAAGRDATGRDDGPPECPESARKGLRFERRCSSAANCSDTGRTDKKSRDPIESRLFSPVGGRYQLPKLS